MRKLRLRLNHLPEITLLISGQVRILIQVLHSKSHALSMILGPPIVPQARLFLGGFPLPGGFPSPSMLSSSLPPPCPTCLLPDPLQSSTSSALTVPRDLPQSGFCGTTCVTMVSSRPSPPPGLPSRLPPASQSQPLCSSVNHYKCPLCDMTCPLPSSLRNHMRFRHSEARPFKCDCCDYR